MAGGKRRIRTSVIHWKKKWLNSEGYDDTIYGGKFYAKECNSMGLIQKVFGTQSEKELKRISPLIDKIESLRPQMMEMSDEGLREKTQEFKKRLGKARLWTIC